MVFIFSCVEVNITIECNECVFVWNKRRIPKTTEYHKGSAGLALKYTCILGFAFGETWVTGYFQLAWESLLLYTRLRAINNTHFYSRKYFVEQTLILFSRTTSLEVNTHMLLLEKQYLSTTCYIESVCYTNSSLWTTNKLKLFYHNSDSLYTC